MLTLTILNSDEHRQIRIADASFQIIGTEGDHPPADSADQSTCRVQGQEVRELRILIEGSASSDRVPTGRVRLRNYGRSVALSSGPRIHRGRTTEIELPASFCVGDTQFQIVNTEVSHQIDEALTSISSHLLPDKQCQRVSPAPETLAAWLETLSDLQQVAAGSQELFLLAAQAVFNPGGLDGCLILLPDEESQGWKIAASHIPYPDHGICFREDLVAAASQSRDTLYHDGSELDHRDNLDDLHTAVVCPVIDAMDQVAAVVYGFRSLNRRNLRKGIRFLEAQFVQVVADSLSAGMIRLASEAEATRSQVLLEQAFSPKLANKLKADLSVLEPTVQEVTILFADLRNFSSMAEQIGASQTFELLSDVMDRFSNAITDLEGVIIDFYGDGISAFWNAPVQQPEHALLACQAAIEIHETLTVLNERWQPKLGLELSVGIGIHTGMASVGNSGSRSRLKYGPRGATVNMASRLESLTRELETPILISGETASRTEGAFETQWIRQASLRGHRGEIDIYRLPVLAKGGTAAVPESKQCQQQIPGSLKPNSSN